MGGLETKGNRFRMNAVCPIIGVSACASAIRLRTTSCASMSAITGPLLHRLHCEAGIVTSEEVRPRCKNRPSAPTVSATEDERDDIMLRLRFDLLHACDVDTAFLRSRTTASRGTSPRSANASQANSSTSSPWRAYFLPSNPAHRRTGITFDHKFYVWLRSRYDVGYLAETKKAETPSDRPSFVMKRGCHSEPEPSTALRIDSVEARISCNDRLVARFFVALSSE
jgi:hypothetical protein